MNISEKLCKMAKKIGFNFTINGKEVNPDEVFSDIGYLPQLVRRADKLCQLCLEYGLGATYNDVDKSTTGIRVQFDDITPNVLRCLFIIDVLMEMSKKSSGSSEGKSGDGKSEESKTVLLDELMYD